MWYAIAVWFAMAEPMAVPVVMQEFKTQTDCIEYIIENSDFNMVVHEQPNIIWLDDGVEDQFAIACQTRVSEA